MPDSYSYSKHNNYYGSGFIPITKLQDVIRNDGGNLLFQVVHDYVNSTQIKLTYGFFYHSSFGAFFDIHQRTQPYLVNYTSMTTASNFLIKNEKKYNYPSDYVNFKSLTRENAIEPDYFHKIFCSNASADRIRHLSNFIYNLYL